MANSLGGMQAADVVCDRVCTNFNIEKHAGHVGRYRVKFSCLAFLVTSLVMLAQVWPAGATESMELDDEDWTLKGGSFRFNLVERNEYKKMRGAKRDASIGDPSDPRDIELMEIGDFNFDDRDMLVVVDPQEEFTSRLNMIRDRGIRHMAERLGDLMGDIHSAGGQIVVSAQLNQPRSCGFFEQRHFAATVEGEEKDHAEALGRYEYYFGKPGRAIKSSDLTKPEDKIDLEELFYRTPVQATISIDSGGKPKVGDKGENGETREEYEVGCVCEAVDLKVKGEGNAIAPSTDPPLETAQDGDLDLRDASDKGKIFIKGWKIHKRYMADQFANQGDDLTRGSFPAGSPCTPADLTPPMQTMGPHGGAALDIDIWNQLDELDKADDEGQGRVFVSLKGYSHHREGWTHQKHIAALTTEQLDGVDIDPHGQGVSDFSDKKSLVLPTGRTICSWKGARSYLYPSVENKHEWLEKVNPVAREWPDAFQRSIQPHPDECISDEVKLTLYNQEGDGGDKKCVIRRVFVAGFPLETSVIATAAQLAQERNCPDVKIIVLADYTRMLFPLTDAEKRASLEQLSLHELLDKEFFDKFVPQRSVSEAVSLLRECHNVYVHAPNKYVAGVEMRMWDTKLARDALHISLNTGDAAMEQLGLLLRSDVETGLLSGCRDSDMQRAKAAVRNVLQAGPGLLAAHDTDGSGGISNQELSNFLFDQLGDVLHKCYRIVDGFTCGA